MINIIQIYILGIVLVSIYLYIRVSKLWLDTPKLDRFTVVEAYCPKVSIIVPIHNEAQHLEQALSSLCASNYSDFEIIAVNDRSDDNSVEILNRLKIKFDFLQIITITDVPEDWLGKTHALQKGIEQSMGDYILLTDADVIFSPLLLKKAIAYMQKFELAHLTLSPHLIMNSFSMKWFMPFQLLIMVFATAPWRANSKNVRSAIGIGAFNCVTRDAFNQIGFMKGLALNPIDDVGLARHLKRKGFKQGFANAQGLLQLEWYGDLKQIYYGFEKNIFAFFEFSMVKSCFALAVYVSLMFVPIIGLLSNNLIIKVLSVIPMLIITCLLSRINSELFVSKYFALFYPLAAFITLTIGIRSIILCLIRGGIYWGGRFTPLKFLKEQYKTDKF